MRIIHPSLIAETIFKVDVSLIDCVIEGDIEMDDDPASECPLRTGHNVLGALKDMTSRSQASSRFHSVYPARRSISIIRDGSWSIWPR